VTAPFGGMNDHPTIQEDTVTIAFFPGYCYVLKWMLNYLTLGCLNCWTGFSTTTWDWNIGLKHETGMWDWNVGLECGIGMWDWNMGMDWSMGLECGTGQDWLYAFI